MIKIKSEVISETIFWLRQIFCKFQSIYIKQSEELSLENEFYVNTFFPIEIINP